MARIRTIKPEYWTDEKIVECSIPARLLFVGMLNFADDKGCMERSPKRIKMQVFPADTIDCEPLIMELITHGLLTEYSVNGCHYLQIPGFLKHQKINRPSNSSIPLPPEFSESSRHEAAISLNGKEPEHADSVNAHGALSEDSVNAHGALTDGKEGKGKERKGKDKHLLRGAEKIHATPSCASGIEPSHARSSDERPLSDGMPDSPEFIRLPLNNGEEFSVTESMVTEWQALYPAVDVRQQLRNQCGWLTSEPTRRKTARGIKKFITGWLAREQDRGGGWKAPGGRPAGRDINAISQPDNTIPDGFRGRG
jgi:hypothetical protein